MPGGCTFTVEVSIIGATPGPACLEPDPSVVLCGPQTYNYFATSISFQSFTASFPLPDRCCINGPAFLSVKLVDSGTCDRTELGIGFEAAQDCISCRSFIAFPFSPPREMCADGWPGNLRQWVDADCCAPVPTVPDTWGRVKGLYR